MAVPGTPITKEDIAPGDKIYAKLDMGSFKAEACLLVDRKTLGADSIQLFSVGAKALYEKGETPSAVFTAHGDVEDNMTLSKLNNFPDPEVKGLNRYYVPGEIIKDRCTMVLMVFVKTGEWVKFETPDISIEDSTHVRDLLKSGILEFYGK